MEQWVGERERWSIGVREREIIDGWAPPSARNASVESGSPTH